MKRLLLSLLAATMLIATATAQTKSPALMETRHDTLHPEIVEDLGQGYYKHFQHPTHPATGESCLVGGTLSTMESYDHYLWEVDEQFTPIGGNLTGESLYVEFRHSGYLKVTVWDEFGNSGVDSIWFNIKDWVGPMEDGLMEIDSAGHPQFSGTIVSRDYRSISISYVEDSIPTIVPVYDSLGAFVTVDTVLRPNMIVLTTFNVHLGQHWSYTDESYTYFENPMRNYYTRVIDTCGIFYELEFLPGMIMGAQPAPGGGWYLTMKSVLQSNKKDGLSDRDLDDYVYALFTVDQQGVRHPFEPDGSQLLLPTSAQSYLIPGQHPDAYYQGAVAKMDRRTREYEIVSFSNKVENPLPDLDGLVESGIPRLSIYPNPSHGTFTVQGTGTITVINMMGQIVATGEAKDGAVAFKLKPGIYFVRDGEGAVEKVVVE